ncbi:MAG: aromatic amino acid lyase [Candidatus Latescibacterota bacterium]|nr:MAG: aromatic amino acid lyase [Candidatus Latescibacterota bacterium]
MSVTVRGSGMTVEEVVRVARGLEPVSIDPEAIRRIEKCRAMLDAKIKAHEIMYGVNTGIGEFSEVVLTDEQVELFQRYLIYSHTAGWGEPFPEEIVRAAMLTRINVHCHGNSGQRPIVTQTLAEMLNRGVTPVVCQKGSVGACGDLSPMGQMALVPIGEGEAFYKGKRMPGKAAMEAAGIPTIVYEARDGLATINGSNVTLGMGCLLIDEIDKFLRTAEIASAMTLEALNANMKPYDERLHVLRGFPGAAASARNIMKVVKGSAYLASKTKKVQDAYSMRSTPQVLGAVRDALRYAREQFLIELNGVGDNPIFIPEDNTVLTGANFQGTPISMPLDLLSIGVTTACVISERRMNRLVNPALSVGLPPFLTKNPGMMSGLMLSQYTAGALICEQRILSHPASTGSIPAAADQEDFVSMGMTSAHKLRTILDNAYGVIAIEMIAGAQALDFRGSPSGPGVRAAYETIRRRVPHLEEDRPLHDDNNRATAAVKSGEILDAVERAVGRLES